MVISTKAKDCRSIVTDSPSFKSHSIALPVGALAIAMISFQVGAALAEQLFPVAGVAGTTTLRLVYASVILAAIWRPWRLRPTRRDARSILVYGIAMGCMNYCFYSALARIPLGIAVALEFTGPLAVAIASSHRAIDYLWVVLAALGLLALLPVGHRSISGVGVAFALGAGVCWALYIVFGQKAGAAHGGVTTALGIFVGALVVAPAGVLQDGGSLINPSILPMALGLAILSSALPYSLEMFALTRIPRKTFGVLMSAAPALGALSGLAFLHERLAVTQWAAIASIMAASAGSAATSGARARPIEG
jgi:inner membrane transporter RhtA